MLFGLYRIAFFLPHNASSSDHPHEQYFHAVMSKHIPETEHQHKHVARKHVTLNLHHHCLLLITNQIEKQQYCNLYHTLM